MFMGVLLKEAGRALLAIVHVHYEFWIKTGQNSDRFRCKFSKNPGCIKKIPPGPDLALVCC
jgi:hypothetical protein